MAQYTAIIGDRRFQIEVDDPGVQVTLDGRAVPVDAQWLDGAHHLSLLFEGRSYDLRLEERNGGLRVTYAGQHYDCQILSRILADLQQRAGAASGRPAGKIIVKSPMPGLVVKVLVEPGAAVSRGDRLLVVEAMKMENEIKAPSSGVVAKVSVHVGDVVEAGRELIVFE